MLNEKSFAFGQVLYTVYHPSHLVTITILLQARRNRQEEVSDRSQQSLPVSVNPSSPAEVTSSETEDLPIRDQVCSGCIERMEAVVLFNLALSTSQDCDRVRSHSHVFK